MRYQDREVAGRELARWLAPLMRRPCIVAGIPRGGVMVAQPVAERLEAPLAVVFAHKLAAPTDPELAFGALDEDGRSLVDPGLAEELGLEGEDIERARGRAWSAMRCGMSLYHAPRLTAFLPGCPVVLVDDGLATGLTMRAAIHYARRHGAVEITVAVPCAAADTAAQLRYEVEHFVCPVVDRGFEAVGRYYRDFSAVSDEDVAAQLARSRAPGGPVGHGGR